MRCGKYHALHRTHCSLTRKHSGCEGDYLKCIIPEDPKAKDAVIEGFYSCLEDTIEIPQSKEAVRTIRKYFETNGVPESVIKPPFSESANSQIFTLIDPLFKDTGPDADYRMNGIKMYVAKVTEIQLNAWKRVFAKLDVDLKNPDSKK